MSREAYEAEARALIAEAQRAAGDEQAALYQRHLARQQDLVNKLSASAARNGTRPFIEARVEPYVRSALLLNRPTRVFLVKYL